MFEQIIVNCPICGKAVVWSNKNLYRPFCCKNCQLIDLGEWINEKKCIYNSSDLAIDNDK